MNAGDPKKAVVLAVVAVAILGIAVVRIIPRPEAKPAAAAAAGADPSAAPGKTGLGRQLRRNPFYLQGLDTTVRNPLARGDASAGGEASVGGDAPEPSEPREVSPMLLPNFDMGGEPSPLQGDLDVRPTEAEPGKPAEIAGIGQQEKQKRQVLVNAVLEVAKTLAYITVGGEEFRVGVGDDLPQIGKVLSISAKGVVVKTVNGKVTLRVGESVEL